MSSAMAYYSDSAGGTTATITATAPGSGLTADTDPVTVTTGVLEIVDGSVTVSSTIAKDGDTVIVTAMATANQAPLAIIETVMAAGGLMTDSLTDSGYLHPQRSSGYRYPRRYVHGDRQSRRRSGDSG